MLINLHAAIVGLLSYFELNELHAYNSLCENA